MSHLPTDLDRVIEKAWQRARAVPGFMAENEIRFLTTMAACTPADGVIVEIGSFKGKSTVGLATVCEEYGLGPVVAIDPHVGDLGPNYPLHSPTFDDFQSSLKSAGVEQSVEFHRALSREAATNWNRAIRLLWIDGDHSYQGCKEDFDLFFPHLSDGAVVAFHDTLNPFEGPIRVFVEDVLRSDKFGPTGFVQSIAWGQYRPERGASYNKQRASLERRAAKLIPFVRNGPPPKGLRKIAYKLNRSRVPRKPISPAEWIRLISNGGE